MLVKVYWTMWSVVLFAAAMLYLTGLLTMVALVAFGFVSFGLVFMGMMSVLPASVAHPPSKGVVDARPSPVVERPAGILGRMSAFKNELMSSNGVEIRRPRFH